MDECLPGDQHPCTLCGTGGHRCWPGRPDFLTPGTFSLTDGDETALVRVNRTLLSLGDIPNASRAPVEAQIEASLR